jgi:hypothetical protein
VDDSDVNITPALLISRSMLSLWRASLIASDLALSLVEC